MHGTIDKAGLEFSVYRGSGHYANCSNASQRKSSHTIWCNKGEFGKNSYLLEYFYSSCSSETLKLTTLDTRILSHTETHSTYIGKKFLI